MRSVRRKVGEAEASVSRRARGAGQAEVAAGHAIEHRIGSGEPRRPRIDRRGERAIARRAVEIGGRARFALEHAAGKRGETAEIPRCDLKPAVHFLRRKQARIARVEIVRGQVERIEGDVASDRSRSAQGELRLAADRAGQRRVGERKAAHRAVTLEGDARRLLGERPVRDGAESRRDIVERALLDMDIARVECAFDRGAQGRPGDRGVEVELADLRRARNRAGMDLDAQRVVRRPAAHEIETGVGGDEVQPGRCDRRIVAKEEIALERRLARKNGADDRERHAFEPGIEVERELPPRALPRHDDIAPRPDLRSGREVKLGVEIVERSCAVEGERDRRQAGKVDEMSEDPAGGLVGIDGEGELLGGRHIGHDGLELARRIEAL